MKPTKEELLDLYVSKNQNMTAIAKKYNTYRKKVSSWLTEYGIPIKDPHRKHDIPKKYDLEVLYSSGKILSDIGKIYNVSSKLVSKWFAKYGIKTQKVTDRIYDMPKRGRLVKLYEKEKMTIKQISGHFDVSCETVRRWLIHYGIDRRSNVRKYAHLRAIPLTKKQHDYLIGVMLGDGHIQRAKRTREGRLNICHSNKQFNYFLYNKDIMDNFVNSVYEIDRIDKRTGNRYHGWMFTSIKHPAITKIHNIFYKNNKKIIPHNIANYLNSFVMAVWIMDDGWLNGKTNIRISTDGFSKSENQTLSFAIKTCFNINSKVVEYKKNNKLYYYLSFNKQNSIKLSQLIDEHIISDMKYKLVRSSTTECQAPARDEDTV